MALKRSGSHSKLWRLGAQVLSEAPGTRWLAGRPAAWAAHRRCNGSCKTDGGHWFCFALSFIKAEILFGFLPVRESRCSCRSFIKVKWAVTCTCGKWGGPCLALVSQAWLWDAALHCQSSETVLWKVLKIETHIHPWILFCLLRY